MDSLLRKDALKYHAEGRPGKIEVVPTKPYSSQRDLALAYSPGVADPCRAIDEDKQKVYDYTAKGNLVGVISNGTAVLGLGDIGPEAGKPVMEGKGFLFKVYADIDVFDIEVSPKDVDQFVQTAVNIAPTFGGINLEDIKAPECFEIERQIKAKVDIPVMHDDQHGTAIITSAGLLNALELNGKSIKDLKVVVSGAGAAAVSCSRLYKYLGVKAENLIMLDSKGVIREDRTDLNEYKREFATKRNIHALDEAIEDADMFLGLSMGGLLKPAMLKKMAPNPVVFALANPEPEIDYNDAIATRSDIIMGTGRSDFPNQVNNVLGFPYIFRGALDVRATDINEEMKIAAAQALADLAKEPVPEVVNQAYNIQNLRFSKDYIIPKPSDPRLIAKIAPAVAKAAMDTGVARKDITNWNVYTQDLRKRMGMGSPIIRQIKSGARRAMRRVVISQGETYKVLKAAEIILDQKLAKPVLLGNEENIRQLVKQYELEVPDDLEVIDPASPAEKRRVEYFTGLFYEKRQRKGITYDMAARRMQEPNYFGSMLVDTGYADALLIGEADSYPTAIRPALESIGADPQQGLVAGMYIINTRSEPYFFADCTVNKMPDADMLYKIARLTTKEVRRFNIEPRIAMVSYSNFGSAKGRTPTVIQEAVRRLHKEYPNLAVDGELQANFALNSKFLQSKFPFSKLAENGANTLIFPYLSAGNIAYKVLQELSSHEIIGPVLIGMAKPVHVLPYESRVEDIVNMISMAANDANKL